MRKMRYPYSLLPAVLAFALVIALLLGVLSAVAGCGSTGGIGTAPIAPTITGGGAGSISGTAIKGPVNGAMVVAFAVSNGLQAGSLGSTMTDEQGNFSVKVGAYGGPVMLWMSGGTYTDDATGAPMTMESGDIMTAVIPAMDGGAALTGVRLTPLTSMAQVLASNIPGGMTATNITGANGAVGHYFMVGDILHVAPMNAAVQGSATGATQDAKNYGMAIAAMSQFAMMSGMTSSSGVVTMMMSDASDGVMNGRMAGGQQVPMGAGMMGGGRMMQANAATTGIAQAMLAFINSPANRSGLTVRDMQALVNQLNTSNGQLK